MQGSSQSVQSQIQNEKGGAAQKGSQHVVGTTRGTSSTSVDRTRVAAAVERWRTPDGETTPGPLRAERLV